ncbi:MAG TPA: SLATT domain-containing protein [Spirochaetota bacterium]|nr:SLATT domain-containing protein [Spirochaetota bacterium]HPI88261.1 SLATT domain-containing protein [Spirochaetota bacterium]HPR47195.1 SLATT domain-containing protein [Spirochaetota bacterium]
MENISRLCDDLLQRMWVTRGARYNAYRRLKKKHDLSIATIAFLSSYALIINSIKFVNFVQMKPHQDNYISFFTMVISVFILVLSLIDSSKDYKMNADKLYISAMEIENLYNELKKVRNSAVSERVLERSINTISNAYSKILGLYQVTHELIDYYLMFNHKRKDSIYDNFVKNFIYAKAFVLPFILYNVMIFITPLVFLFFLLRV